MCLWQYTMSFWYPSLPPILCIQGVLQGSGYVQCCSPLGDRTLQHILASFLHMVSAYFIIPYHTVLHRSVYLLFYFAFSFYSYIQFTKCSETLFLFYTGTTFSLVSHFWISSLILLTFISSFTLLFFLSSSYSMQLSQQPYSSLADYRLSDNEIWRIWVFYWRIVSYYILGMKL